MNSIFYLFIFTISFVNANWYTNNGSIYNNDKIYNIIGCNWNGIETECKVPHGLWLNPLEYYITFLKENGFNSVRIPLSYEIMTNLSTPINNNCVLLNLQYINQTIEFVLEDLFIQLNNNNITILVDLHTIDNIVTECPWTESISYVNTIDAWIHFLNKFSNYIFGIELKNEPHNLCSFYEFIDWIDNAIYRIETETVYDGLYFISGVQYSFNDNQIIHHWDGVLGNLQGVHFPSFNFQDLSEMNLNSSVIPHNRLVFCPHIFGPLISDYFTITGPIDWEKNFGYISTKDWKWKDVPIIFTAMGGWLEGPTLAFYTEFQKWCHIKGFNKGLYWWALPPTSIETGGLLDGYDWKQIDYEKISYIKNFFN
jgi:hypothetical protein